MLTTTTSSALAVSEVTARCKFASKFKKVIINFEFRTNSIK